jgi:hypothetical protein
MLTNDDKEGNAFVFDWGKPVIKELRRPAVFRFVHLLMTADSDEEGISNQ